MAEAIACSCTSRPTIEQPVPGGGGEPQPRASCPKSDIEQRLPGRKFEPLLEVIQLLRGQPTVLSNVLAIGVLTNLCVQVRLKIPIMCIVVVATCRETLGTHPEAPLMRFEGHLP